jgi:hypothetical protein
MELAVEFRFCHLDHLPIDQSLVYRDLCGIVGKRKAMRWTYKAEVPVISRHPPPEREEQWMTS